MSTEAVDVRAVMTTLLTHFEATTVFGFTADAISGDPVLANVSASTGLFEGLPVFGPGIPRGATIDALDAGAGTLTLSIAPTTAATAGAFKCGFQTLGRRVIHWDQVSAQPALFTRRIGMSYEYDHDGLLLKRTIEGEAWLYANAGQDPKAVPDDALSVLEQLVLDSFAPDDGEDALFTLGGLVYWCRFEGQGDISPGDQGGQALARMPFRITLP